MVYAELGRYGEAVKWQQAAIGEARSQRRVHGYLDYLEKNLQRYKQGKPCRTAWTDFYDGE